VKKGLVQGRSGFLEGGVKEDRWAMKEVRKVSVHPSKFEHHKIDMIELHNRLEPLNKVEKISFLTSVLFFEGFLFLTQVYGIWFLIEHFKAYSLITLFGLIGIAGTTLLATQIFLFYPQNPLLSKMHQFFISAQLSSQISVDEYIERNPIMRAVWKQSGYKLA